MFLTKNHEIENVPNIDMEFIYLVVKKNKYPLCLVFTMATVMMGGGEWNVKREIVVLVRTATMFTTLKKVQQAVL